MDNEFEKRWRTAVPPFDGQTPHLENFVTVVDALPILSAVIDTLYDRFANESLYTYPDWHEHDGFVTTAQSASWTDLIDLTASDTAILRISTGDFAVRTAYFSDSRRFLLRIDVPAPHDNPHHDLDDPNLVPYAIFDVTGDNALIDRIAETMKGIAPAQITPAKVYFEKRYGG